MIDFEGYLTKDIESWIGTTARFALASGGSVFPSTKTKRVLALLYWVNR